MAHMRGGEEGEESPHHTLCIEEKRAVLVMGANCIIKMASPEVSVGRCGAVSVGRAPVGLICPEVGWIMIDSPGCPFL